MNGRPLKILHLEDNAMDAQLFAADLRVQWPDCEIDVVTGREEFIAGITRQSYDLVLSDFSMAVVGFDGLTALRFVREHHPETPFIFLSGSIGEERAVEAIRNGAVDYVRKDRPKRLIPAVRYALALADQSRQKTS